MFDDDYLVVVDKIAKVLTQASKKDEKNNLTSLLRRHLGYKVFPCHRLDRQTTGLLIYAKSASVEKMMFDRFRYREVEKKYLAFVKGNFRNKRGSWQGRIIDRQGRIFSEKSKYAKTFYRVLRNFNGWSVLELSPVTGRTNQLRIQLAGIGHPILGEDKYAFRRDFPPLAGKFRFKRLALHAFYLSFSHPVSRNKITLEIGPAEDMQKFLNRFEKMV